jgi:hypothetical protein
VIGYPPLGLLSIALFLDCVLGCVVMGYVGYILRFCNNRAYLDTLNNHRLCSYTIARLSF